MEVVHAQKDGSSVRGPAHHVSNHHRPTPFLILTSQIVYKQHQVVYKQHHRLMSSYRFTPEIVYDYVEDVDPNLVRVKRHTPPT